MTLPIQVARAASIAGGLAVLVIGGCRSGDRYLAPFLLVPGSYLMTTAGGQVPPAVIQSGTDSASGKPFDLVVVADTLDLTAAQRYEQRAQLERRVGGQATATQRWVDHGSFILQGTALHFVSDTLQNVAFDGTIGEIRSVNATQAIGGTGIPLPYQFVRAP